MPKRRCFAAGQKAPIVLEALKEEKSIAQIASENSIYPEVDKTGLTDTSVHTLAIDPMVPATLYVGTDSGDGFKSTDVGRYWREAKTGIKYTDVGALAINPTTPATFFVWLWGSGVYKSTDGGGKWRVVVR
jgi:hypothetical protein